MKTSKLYQKNNMNPSLSLSLCLPMRLSVYACVYVSFCVSLSVCRRVSPSVCLPVYLSLLTGIPSPHTVWKFPHYNFHLPAPSPLHCDVVLFPSYFFLVFPLFVFLEPRISPLPTNFTHLIYYSQHKKLFTPFPDCYLCFCLFLYLWSPNKRQNACAIPFRYKWRMELVT